MRLAIMQPYLFPYPGYFRLIAAVDKLIFYDDVNFIKGGWINRNRLVLGGAIKYFTIPLANQSPFKKIREIEVAPHETWRRAMREALRHAYGKAPCYNATMHIFDAATESGGIGEMAKRSVTLTSEYLGLDCNFVESSTDYHNDHLSGQARIIDICKLEGATAYINAPGGHALYDHEEFAANGIALHFMDGVLPEYSRGANPRVAGLSILDMLMFHPADAVRSMLTEKRV